MTIGVDIGGTKVALGVFADGTSVSEAVFPTGGYEKTVQAIASWCRGSVHFDSVSAVGVGCPGPLDEEAGVVLNDDTLDGWDGRCLVDDLRNLVGRRVVLSNDADAALLGELAGGALADHRNEPAVMLTFGTGVGGAAWMGDRILEGAGREHPEIGHVAVLDDGPRCYCGLVGCLEVVASGTALRLAGEQAGLTDWQDSPEIVSRAQTAIRRGIASIAHVLRPASIVLGGGVMNSCFSLLAPPNPWESKMLIRPLRILPAKLGNRAGMVGAAWLAESLS